jgi:diacylglycerol kinase family enzyme
MPEAYLIEPDCDLLGVVRDAIAQGIRMFVVCGGDGTISAVARAMIGTNANLGIIPTGTQNNVALSLGIPTDIPAAIAILRTGQRSKVDVGIVNCGDISTPFIEICSVGLFSTLFPSVDDIQHGDIARIGDFLATLSTSPPSYIHLLLDDKQEIQKLGHVVLISNMPYVGRHYQVGSLDSFNDGLLDVLFFADLSKLDLIGYVLKGPGTSTREDPRIQHFRVRRVVIDTQPSMPIMADGITLGEGLVRIEVRRHALAVMVGSTAPNVLTELGEILEK